MPAMPRPHTEAEVATVLRLLLALRPRAESVVIGSSRDAVSLATSEALGAAWTGHGGQVLDTVDWPETAASWLRQARRFTAGAPDAWVVAGQVTGWLQMGLRLARSTAWTPSRTIATASLADPQLIARAGPDTFDGLRGAYRDGGVWEINRVLLIDHRFNVNG